MTTTNLYAALRQAQLDVSPLEHDTTGFTGNDEFRYTSAESIIDAARQHLLANGLVGRRCGWLVTPPTENRDMCVVTCKFILIHTESGETLEDEVVSIAQSWHGTTLEKAVNAYLTRSLAYWLRDLLLIPRFHEVAEPTTPPTPAVVNNLLSEGEDKAAKAFTNSMTKISNCKDLAEMEDIIARITVHPDISKTCKVTLMSCAKTKQKDLKGDAK